MTLTAPTFSQIKAQVAAIRQKIPDASLIGIQTTGRWIGESCYQDGAQTYVIEQCDSPLAMRIALRNNQAQTIKVLITSLDESVLGDDILLRLAKRRLFPLDNWQIVKSLFQAQAIDPRLKQSPWIADYLIEQIPVEGYSPVTSGFLDAETVWSILLSRGIELTGDRPDLVTILHWSIDSEHIAKYQKTPADFRQAAVDWLVTSAGSAAKTILDCIAENERPDAVPIGLAAAVVFHPKVGLGRAIGKIEERYLGGISPEQRIIEQWSNAAAEVVRSQAIERTQQNRLLQRADEILHEVGAESFAYLSPISPTGFDQRLASFGKYLQKIVEANDYSSLNELTDALALVREHHQARELRRLERIDMAMRLARWLLQPNTHELQSRSLAEAINYHVTEGSFLDWARLTLRSGDPVRALSQAYTLLFEKVTAIREKQAYQFAKLLQDWTAIGSTTQAILPIEHILELAIAPLAKHAPLLIIIMDGMSMAVCRELVTDITAGHEWTILHQEKQSALIAGLAAIPSITEVSRTSLLCGQLRRGNQNDERSRFASHPALLTHCKSSFPPLLFHKSSLREQEDAGLAADVLQAISVPQNRIVGVVINAVDDYLLKGEQLDIRWSCSEIKVLSSLLYEAKQYRRLVILLSDHGHIIDYKTESKKIQGCNERWRSNDGQLEENELTIRGSRVVIPGSKTLIAPWSEKLRYGMKKNGYHGGLTPQEMVVPIAVLSSNTSYPKGWIEAAVDTPPWWDEPIEKIDEATKIPTSPSLNQNSHLGPLFNLAEETARPTKPVQQIAWITDFLSSKTYAAQKRLVRGLAPTDDILVKILVTLDKHGSKMNLNILARTINYPATQIRELLTTIQRILNVDGYAVLTCNRFSDIVELNRDLLCKQFDITTF